MKKQRTPSQPKFVNRAMQIAAGALFLLILLSFCVLYSLYYKKLSGTIRDENKVYLQEVSSRIGSNVERMLDDNFGVLLTIGSALETMGNPSSSEVSELLQKQHEVWNYDTIFYVDSSGAAYDADGKALLLQLDDDIRDDVVSGRQTMSVAQTINNQEYILFSTPVESVTVDGRALVAVAGCYDTDSFDKTLSMESFDKRAYSEIISSSGDMVIRSSSPHAIPMGGNVLTFLEGVDVDSGGLEQLKSDLAGGDNGQINIAIDGSHMYMVYSAVKSQDWFLVTYVPVDVVNAQSSQLLRTTIIVCCITTFTFAALCIVLFFAFSRHRRRLEHLAYVDNVTGGSTIQHFYVCARKVLDDNPDKRFALIYTNIAKFKVLNEQIGWDTCDAMLSVFSRHVASKLGANECMGHISADNFCILIEYVDEDSFVSRLSTWYNTGEEYLQNLRCVWTMPPTMFGIYVIEKNTMTFPQMIDRAKLALKVYSRTVGGRVRYSFYDDDVRAQLFREKQLEDMMDAALVNSEFCVYLQPQYKLPEEAITSAEALVRWRSPTEGMIFPDEFIPLFEKNGFVVKLDLWVFEQVCIMQKRWEREGRRPIRVAVNCSRIHFMDDDYLKPYIEIADRYEIDKGLLEIELTESIVLENSDRLIKIIKEIKAGGFCCSMDDFGSGYSSLNLIQQIPVDTLKLDRVFFQSESVDAERTEAVITSILTMAKVLSMKTVAEGVEQRDQVEMLKRAGCDYIQGYVFACPMPISEFEQKAFGGPTTK